MKNHLTPREQQREVPGCAAKLFLVSVGYDSFQFGAHFRFFQSPLDGSLQHVFEANDRDVEAVQGVIWTGHTPRIAAGTWPVGEVFPAPRPFRPLDEMFMGGK